MTPKTLMTSIDLLVTCALMLLGIWMVAKPAWPERITRAFALRAPDEEGVRMRQTVARVAGFLMALFGLVMSYWTVVRLVS